MTEKESLFNIWAPPGNPWSRWVKPILFAHWPRELPKVEVPPAEDCSWAPRTSERIALIVELPGARSVAAGLALAAAGYRPIPIFNGAPAPITPRHPSEPLPESRAVVDVDSILAALVECADRLAAIEVPAGAPPAFLIDQLRSTAFRPLAAGRYDNRSWIYTTDFPSPERIKSEGIAQVLLATGATGPLAEDLEHLLRVWVSNGCEISVKRLSKPGPSEPFRITRFSWITAFKLWVRSRFSDPVLGRGHFISGAAG